MAASIARTDDALYDRVAQIIETARTQVARTVNTAMVHAYWLVGREIVEVEQRGKERAGYGDQLIEELAKRLSSQFGRGFGVATLRRARSFYLTYPRGSAIPPDSGGLEIRSTPLIESGAPPIRSAALIESAASGCGLFPPLLGWSHYLVLLRVQDDEARSFYEIAAAREGWSVRELERQIASLLFERLAKSRDREQVLTLAKKGQTIAAPKDVIKDPFVMRSVT